MEYKIYRLEGWNNDDFGDLTSDKPLYRRGGGYNRGIAAGGYYYKSANGTPNKDYSFRICLAIIP